jgi:beta-xylosidase
MTNRPTPATWTADNGDGTFTNPLFYEEFSDPDIIRVGDCFFMTGTTMHTMPGLPILRSRDLVNWELLTYAFDRLDLGPDFRLEGGDIYGQGIWAPCLRYHAGRFLIFSNINKHNTQIFEATDPAGPWTRREMKKSLHDLSVLFDDDGKAYVVWGYRNLQLAQLTDDLTDLVPGTQTELFGEDTLMGEGAHIYKVDGRYFITSAWFAGSMRLAGARADHIFGPWEVNSSLSEWEDFGLWEGNRMEGGGLPFTARPPFTIVTGNTRLDGRVSIHQGGIVDTPNGEWWGWSMMDYNALGRLTALSPITWHEGWPYFGLPGNLGRTPRTWFKPDVAQPSEPKPWLERNDNFRGKALKPIWQWNHVPDDHAWSLHPERGVLRLQALTAPDFFHARNTLTQRAVGPLARARVRVDARELTEGAVAGLGLLGLPYRHIGIRRTAAGWQIELFDQQTGETVHQPIEGPVVTFEVSCDFLTETAQFGWVTDADQFEPLGPPMLMAFQLKTFQGMRFGLFCFRENGSGGAAEFSDFRVQEPFPSGLMRPVPAGATIEISRFSALGVAEDKPVWRGTVEALGQARVHLLPDSGGVLSVAANGEVSELQAADGDGSTFLWVETPYGELVLMSLQTNRFLRFAPGGQLRADAAGPDAYGEGVRLDWQPVS